MPIIVTKRGTRRVDSAANLAWQIQQGLRLVAELEYKFHPTRKWRFDVALFGDKLAIEIDGGLFLPGGGRHSRGAGARGDAEKFCEAAILGWRILRVLPEWVASGQAFTYVERAIKAPKLFGNAQD